MNILQACRDPNLFARWFTRKGKKADTWTAWFAILAAIFALPMTDQQLETYRTLTGRTEPPTKQASEAWLIVGRRAGKSFILALIAVYLAAFHNYKSFLQPGERAVVLIIAADRRQARVIFRYVRALLTGVPMLREMIQRQTNDTFDLENRTTIEIATASYRTVRGYTLVAALLDELAFWPTEGMDPDSEVIAALRPAMATIPNSMLLCASSPYARKGSLFKAHEKHFAIDGDPILVIQGSTRQLNPCVPQRVIDEAYEDDPIAAAAEYGGLFRSDATRLITSEAIAACVTAGIFERAPQRLARHVAFVDPSGGSADSFTIAIAHADDDGTAILDCVREVRPPFSPEAVVQEFAALAKTYGCTSVTGDKYAGEFPRELFRKCGLAYYTSEKTKSEIYLSLLPLINSRKVQLLDDKRLLPQLSNLERRTARGGKDSIDHAPGAHDDIANSAAGALTMVTRNKGRVAYGVIDPTGLVHVLSNDAARTRAWQRGRVIETTTRLN
ncbi:MAG: hypothetical protein Q8M31_19345 [Beijerinckiaceae bacterium]|nr:hypothetical protein [Beijerinckiaceae bacterium]